MLLVFVLQVLHHQHRYIGIIIYSSSMVVYNLLCRCSAYLGQGLHEWSADVTAPLIGQSVLRVTLNPNIWLVLLGRGGACWVRVQSIKTFLNNKAEFLKHIFPFSPQFTKVQFVSIGSLESKNKHLFPVFFWFNDTLTMRLEKRRLEEVEMWMAAP